MGLFSLRSKDSAWRAIARRNWRFEFPIGIADLQEGNIVGAMGCFIFEFEVCASTDGSANATLKALVTLRENVPVRGYDYGEVSLQVAPSANQIPGEIRELRKTGSRAEGQRKNHQQETKGTGMPAIGLSDNQFRPLAFAVRLHRTLPQNYCNRLILPPNQSIRLLQYLVAGPSYRSNKATALRQI